MLSKEELITKYQQYSDNELLEVYSNRDGYSKDANEAIDIVLESKGGLDAIKKNLLEKKVISDEINRIKRETEKLCSKETNAEFIKSLVSSSILPKEKVSEIVDSKYSEFEAHLKDTKIDSKTIVKAAVGGTIASLVGGAFWGLQLIYSNRIFIILVVGLALLCYGIVKLVVKKSKENKVVVIASLISFMLAILLGTLIFQIVGYQG